MPSLSVIKQLSKQLNACINVDKYQYKRQLDRLRNESQKGQNVESKLADLSQKIEASIGKRQKRKDSIPVINYADLPVTDKKEEIADLIRQNQVLILCGETGSGKTTQIPKICLEIGRGVAGFIGHTQPRRIAARTVADRIAEELGQTIGQSVGYKVRFHDKTHDKSLVKLMTDGILLAESQNDPYLNQYDTLIIDEAHERSLNIDFLLGYLRWLLPRRPDLKLIITSATIDPERFSKHFNNAPIINVSGRTYPVEMRYRPIELIEEDDETSANLQQAIIDAVDELHRDIPGDILIFLNGEREIRETAESLRKHNPKNCEILPLYSKLSVSEQERVFKPKGKMRIVLATNVAETSLTVPGIRSVIDIGHARISRYSHRSKIQRLPIEKISQASANQRAGRCGRVAEGICIRLYSEEDYLARAEFTEPEILRTHLSSVILQMMSLKLGDIEDFPFVEAPTNKMIRDGKKSLEEVNALDKEGKLTAVGRQLAKIPTDPKLARMLLAANQLNCLTEVSIIVSALSIQDPREKPADKMQQADSKHAQFKIDDSDFLTLLNIWNVFATQKKELSNNQLRKYCKVQFLSYIRMREWFDIHSQIMQVIKGELKFKPNSSAANYEAIHCALLPGLLSNIGFRHEQYQYLGGRNLKFFIFPGSGQHKAKPKWIMAAEQVETSKVYARTVAKIKPEWIEQSAQHLIKSSYYEPHWEKKAGRSAIYERTLLYGLTLQPKRKIPYERIDPKAAREIFIRYGLVAQDYHSNAPFFKANKKLLEEVGYIQHKGRRVDLIEDEEWLYQFYHQKLPEQVVNGITLDKWRKTAEKESPKILFLSKQDLTRQEDETVSEQDYPDHKMVGNLSIELQYRFEPGHDEDGVTAIIPVHQLNQISTQAFEWLVPGLLEEKVIALLKGLPKQVRKHFIPVSNTAKACLEIEPEMKGSLYDWLGMRLRKLTGEAIPLTQWNRESLADHLKMNYRVVDDKGHALDYGRKLKILQEKYTAIAGDSFNEIAADALNYTGCIRWVFDDLPESYAFTQKGQSFIGFPAIIDEGDAVGVGIFDTRIKAQQAHYDGLVRLFQSVTRKESKYVIRNLAKTDASELQYNHLSSHAYVKNRAGENFREDILFNIIATVFLQEGDIRSQLQFDECLNDNKQYMLAVANNIGKIVVNIMDRVSSIKKALSQPNIGKELFDDITEQMNCLVYVGFIRYTPYDQLKSIPRYLKAMEYRIDKQKDDQQNRQILNRYWKRFWKEVEKKSTKQNVIPEQDKFRWDLEELRVSLFAQQLKTAYPISPKRLDKAWDERI
ncbi:MAG: ATP-dependent RNA helicase HrpA [Methylococcales symbiont of Hymedesmia sp. n. MRB-2018]|nr:MAG: ATP-dependent RNA helicase HrpA [Methylococcales symbiont of Hymedesmia sp. n. MRB-2018]